MAEDPPGFLARLGRAVVWVSLVIFLTGLAAAGYFAWRLCRDTAETFADPVAQFKYGSTGGDRNFGIPYAMWEAMPTLFRDLLPEGREDEGWAAFGFLYEDPAQLPPELHHPRPVGTSLRTNLGIDRIFLNCAGCHAGSVRTGPGEPPLIVAGMPSNTVDLSAFQGFLAEAAVDERFSADRFLSEIDARGIELDLVNRLALKFVGIGMVRERLLAIVDRFDDFVHNEPTFGPGRFDTFNPAKALLNWRFDQIPEAERIGVVDFPSVFLQGPKEGMQLHWDGNNTKVSERNRSAAFGTGATPPILDRASLQRIEDWLATAEPPPFADVFPAQFDPALAALGAPVYAGACAGCHGASGRDFTGEYVGQVTPIGAVGTDRGRLDNYTDSPSTRTPSTPSSAPSGSRPSARPTATPTRPSTASGCAPPTCTTARSPRSQHSSPRPPSAPPPSCAAMTSTTPRRWASRATPPASTPPSRRTSSATSPAPTPPPSARPARPR